MSDLQIPSIELNDGNLIPQLGLGVFKVEPGDTERIVSEALEVGYRHIDTARIYENEAEVGRAIAASGIDRDELFITTKLWNTDQEDPHSAFEASLERLGLEKVDLYLVHWPVPARKTAVTAWRGLVEIVGSAQCDSIGVSNFEIAHLNELLHETGVVPTVNQVELHPYFPQAELRARHAELGILTEAWSPLGKRPTPFAEPPIVDAATAHGVSPAQVVLRWHLQLGTLPIPKSKHPDRQRENLDVYSFTLSDDEVAAITALGRADGRRFGGHPDTHEEM